MSERHMATVTGQTMKVPNNVIIVLIVSLLGFYLIVYIYYQLLVELKAITRSASLINHVACIATNPHCERHLKSRWCNHNSFTQLNETTQKNITHEPVNLAVTQTTERYELQFYRCHVESRSVMGRCGKSIDTIHHAGLFSEIVRIGRHECDTMHKKKVFRIVKDGSFSDIQLSSKGQSLLTGRVLPGPIWYGMAESMTVLSSMKNSP